MGVEGARGLRSPRGREVEEFGVVGCGEAAKRAPGWGRGWGGWGGGGSQWGAGEDRGSAKRRGWHWRLEVTLALWRPGMGRPRPLAPRKRGATQPATLQIFQKENMQPFKF